MGFELSREQVQRFTGRGDIAQLARALAQGDDAEDLVQDACLTALDQPSAPARFEGWSRQVLRNRFRDRLRRKRRRRVREAKYQAGVGGFESDAHTDLMRLLQAYPQLGVVWLAATPYNSTESAYLARAAFAAQAQGQFWPWHAAVNDRQPRRERTALLKLAGELKLDVARFADDLDSVETLRGVANNRAWCRSQKCYGSPCVFFGELVLMGHWGYERLEQALLDQL